MPIYEYRCPEGHTFELFQRMTDPPSSECQICGAKPVQKVMHPAAIHFKGSGFYSTDYGRSRKKEGSKDGDAPSEGAKKDEKTSEKKDTPPEKKAAET